MPPTSYSQRVAEMVRAAMDSAQISTRTLAETAAIPRVTLSRRLTGTDEGFTIDELARIARALDKDILDFISAASAA